MKRISLLLLLAFAVPGALPVPALVAWAGGTERLEAGGGSGAPAIGLEADRILKAMSEYLQAAEEFTFEADVTYDSSLLDGLKIQHGSAVKVAVRRPDRLHVEFDGDERRSQIVIDRETFTFHDRVDGMYATTKVPSGLDAAIDTVFETYGFSVPIADIVYADPYRTLAEGVERGFLVGRHRVDGVPCHHLTFSQETIDWQIWIEDGPVPVPRKLVITYKAAPDSPQYVARLKNWSFQPRLSGHYFEFHPPAEADETEFLPPPEIPDESGEEVER